MGIVAWRGAEPDGLGHAQVGMNWDGPRRGGAKSWGWQSVAARLLEVFFLFFSPVTADRSGRMFGESWAMTRWEIRGERKKRKHEAKRLVNKAAGETSDGPGIGDDKQWRWEVYVS